MSNDSSEIDDTDEDFDEESSNIDDEENHSAKDQVCSDDVNTAVLHWTVNCHDCVVKAKFWALIWKESDHYAEFRT